MIRLGFEPKTHSLEGCCSIQLSYQTIVFGCKGSKFSLILHRRCRFYFALAIARLLNNWLRILSVITKVSLLTRI